ncbi:MAG: hypothetical protein KAJ42_00320 [Gemmatimonadetes bacterium]|nr:hypothetical protein [Gemmatimonadota bacterium]
MMMSYPRRFVPVALTLIAVAGCSRYGDPSVGDGLYLEYTYAGSETCRLEFHAEGGDFRVTRNPVNCAPRPEPAPPAGVLVVDEYVRTSAGAVTWGELSGEFGPIWIPEEMRTVGRHRFGIPLNVTEISSWGGREVAVMLQALGPLRVKSYYALDTGFLVAVEKEFGGGPNLIIELTSTNAVR